MAEVALAELTIVADLEALRPERDRLIDAHVEADHLGFADHDSRAIVDEEPFLISAPGSCRRRQRGAICDDPGSGARQDGRAHAPDGAHDRGDARKAEHNFVDALRRSSFAKAARTSLSRAARILGRAEANHRLISAADRGFAFAASRASSCSTPAPVRSHA